MARRKSSTSPAAGGRAVLRAGREGRSRRAAIEGDPESTRRVLRQARHERNWSGVTYWRQVLTVSAAAQRARAGDRTAERRLAWRKLVLEGRGLAEELVMRYKRYEAELGKRRREPSHPDCAACYLRQEHSRQLREQYLAEIAALQGTVPTYAEYCHREDASSAEAVGWLRRQLEGLDGGQA